MQIFLRSAMAKTKPTRKLADIRVINLSVDWSSKRRDKNENECEKKNDNFVKPVI